VTAEDPAGPPQLLEVGRITKSHGLRGEVVVALTTDRSERLDPGSVLATDRGPLVVVGSRPHQDRWLVVFEGCVDRTSADELRGLVLRATPLEDPDELWVHELIGCTVLDADGLSRGTVESVIANPAADLLQLDDGTLVPVVFVVGPPEGGTVVVDAPEGLFDLNRPG
jgi:16S rRNA processing protein RimM